MTAQGSTLRLYEIAALLDVSTERRARSATVTAPKRAPVKSSYPKRSRL